MKLPIFNNHRCEGIYDKNFKLCPSHYCWVSHILLGILSIKFDILVVLFVLYQLTQILQKKRMWDDIVDIIEFFIGRYIGNHLNNKL